MDIVKREIAGYVKDAKAIAKEGPITFVASTSDPDRMDDIVLQNWRLKNFLANPVILQNHEYDEPVVGKATRAEVVQGQLEVDILFDESPDNPDGMRLARQVREGFVRAVSVGFLPSGMVPRRSLPDTDNRKAEWGYLLDDNELLEVSIVTVPANAAALAKRFEELRARSTPAPTPEPPAPEPAPLPEPARPDGWWLAAG